MQTQYYWTTKKNVLRRLGGKEDECIVSSDAELDAKLELFKSINDCCFHLQRHLDVYQERLCFLAQEENALGRYLKECGKNEKNASAGQILSTAGKALAYTGQQRLTVRPPLVRLHHEVETFRCRAISDTRATVVEMEKARTEYRAALDWIKSASSQLDPDTNHGLDRFRKAQSYVKTTKAKFDRLALACLQKVDLLAAARCNMFSHALVPYENALSSFSNKANESLMVAAAKLDNNHNPDASNAKITDKYQSTFFNSEYSDKITENTTLAPQESSNLRKEDTDLTITDLLGEDFSSHSASKEIPSKSHITTEDSLLLDLSWPFNESSDFPGGEFMPSTLLQHKSLNFPDLLTTPKEQESTPNKNNDGAKKQREITRSQMSWLQLFSELDPLANPDQGGSSLGDRA